MVSFRKIVNVLVLIAYVKMTLVSSFAMDAPFHNATRAFKVTLEPTLGRNGEVQAMKLRLIQQDRSGEGKAERLLTQAEINVTHNTYTPNLKLITRNGTPWFVWRLPQFGVIQIDQNGNMLLEGINQHHPATILKIKTSHLIMLHNCAIHNLHLTGHAAHLKGNNIFGNLKANLGLTLTTLRDRQEQLRNLILKNGRFVNWSTINWQGGGIWNLRGNSLVNQGTLNLEEGAQTLQQALLVSNLGRIQGRQLNITTHNFHNLGTMDLASLWLYARHNLINQGQIHSRHQSHYQFGHDFKNSGQINSEGSFLITSIQDQGTLTNIGEIQAHQSRFENLKLVNHHELTLQNSDWQTVNVENTGRFLLGHIDPATQSVIPTLTNQGYMAGTGTLTVAEDGENTGELQLSDAELILPDSVFDNQGTIWLSRLSGNGQFFNRGTYCTATTDAKAVLNIRDFHNDFPGARLQGGRVEGQENLWNFVTDHASTIELVSLIFHKVGRAGSPFNDLKGTVNVDFLKLDQSPVKLLGTLAAKMVQITNGSLLVTESGQVTASTSILDQVQFTNEGSAELGEVRLIW
ncbi:hypothetical protein [Candidatus Odyssella thessalonicensis]|uniref:hypothetical protein n=1 Tax=Candidatus Odyssella thessalonicensis TaxID=84647 RepID=UPI000225BEC1|nr:hypothetical protein [Candidatus Odyssella thessalonicensis]